MCIYSIIITNDDDDDDDDDNNNNNNNNNNNKERDLWGGLGVDGRTILEWTLKR